MKLRAKIQLSFVATIVVLLMIVGNVVSSANTKASISIATDSMATSSHLVSGHISSQLNNYMGTVTLIGKDEILKGNATSEEKMEFLNMFVDMYGFTSANILDAKGVSLKDGTDFSDRGYVQLALSGKPNISEVTLSKYTGTYGISIAAPTYDRNDNINGVVYFRLDFDFIISILESVSISENSYAYIIDKDGNIIAHPDEELIFNFNVKENRKTLALIADEVLAGKSGNGEYTLDGKEIFCGYDPIPNTDGWGMIIAAPKKDFTKQADQARNTLAIMIIAAVVIAIVISAVVAQNISKPVQKVKDALVSVSDGHFDIDISETSGKDEVAVLQNTTVSLVNTLSSIIGQVNSVLSAIARYDLTSPDMNSFQGDFDSISVSVNSIKKTLSQLILEVQSSVSSVDVGSRELAEATAALSQGTVAQAGSIQTLADDLAVVVGSINRNSENEELVNKRLGNLDKKIQNANAQMQGLLDAVCEVETMSSGIQKIVSTIDNIAFQTNILSLNASVEAARAGEMGSGFAVVAEEVRGLAQKCSDSSKKTSELINQCISLIDNAKKCADATFDSLSGIVVDSSEISQAFEEISAHTAEQAVKSNRIQTEINNISDVIQTNTATVEETASSTAVLSDQAMNLGDMIKNFKVPR